MNNLFQHAHWIEWTQLGTALIALILTFWSVWDALEDATVLRAAGINGSRAAIAANNIRQEMMKMAAKLVLVILGALSVFLPPPTQYDIKNPKVVPLIEMANQIDPHILEESELTRQMWFITRTGLITISLLLMVDSIMTRRFRVGFVKQLRQTRSSDKVSAAQVAATAAQASASLSQAAATAAQDTATAAQIVATEHQDADNG